MFDGSSQYGKMRFDDLTPLKMSYTFENNEHDEKNWRKRDRPNEWTNERKRSCIALEHRVNSRHIQTRRVRTRGREWTAERIRNVAEQKQCNEIKVAEPTIQNMPFFSLSCLLVDANVKTIDTVILWPFRWNPVAESWIVRKLRGSSNSKRLYTTHKNCSHFHLIQEHTPCRNADVFFFFRSENRRFLWAPFVWQGMSLFSTLRGTSTNNLVPCEA